MAYHKVLFRKAILILLILLLAVVSTIAAGNWETISSFKDIRRVRLINDTLFLATSGGILALSDPDLPGYMCTNIDGLGTVDMTDIIEAADGQKWATGFGQLVKFDLQSSQRFPTLPVYGPLNLRRVVDDGDRLWVGSDSGLVLFAKVGVDDGGYRNRYRITTINPNPIVFDILLEGDLIWLATLNGLAVAERTDPIALLAPSNWTLFDINSNPELATNEVRRMTLFEDSLYLITVSGVFRMSVGATDTSFTEIPVGSGLEFFDMRVDNDSLFIYYSSGLAVIKEGALAAIPSPGMPSAPVTGFNTGSFRWLAAKNGWGFFKNRTGSYEEYIYTGTPGNTVTDVSIAVNGTITGGFFDKRSAVRISDLWVTQPYEPAFRSTVLGADRYGNRWIGTKGGGLWRDDGTSLVNFNDTNSTIRGNNDNSLFAWVSGLDISGDYLYASMFMVYNDYPVAIARLDANGYPVAWDSLGLSDGLTDIGLVAIDYHDGILAVGSGFAGLYYCTVGADPFDRPTDACVHIPKDSLFLPSNTITAVRFSPDGVLWVGTNFGIVWLDVTLGRVGEIGRFIQVNLPAGFGPAVTAIEFDSRGNVWIGARNGLARLDVSLGAFELFTTVNSDLVSDEINNLTYDPISGDLFVATNGGISKYLSTTGRLTSELDSVLAYPNPFVIGSAGDRLQFSFARPYTVRVFSVAGELVWEVTELSDRPWDGRNQNGEQVASGVYLFVLKDSDGKVAKGKFLLVRR